MQTPLPVNKESFLVFPGGSQFHPEPRLCGCFRPHTSLEGLELGKMVWLLLILTARKQRSTQGWLWAPHGPAESLIKLRPAAGGAVTWAAELSAGDWREV